MDSQPSPKRIILLILGVILLVFLTLWLWHYYHTGKIIITTNNRYNTITLAKTNSGNNGGVVQSFKAHSKLSVTVASGEYTVSVSGNSVATVQTINLKPRQTLRYTINPINTTGVEPVAYKNALSLAASNDQLVYLNGSDSLLYKIDNQNNLTNIENNQSFQATKWAGPSFGVGQDNKGYLYTITNGTASLLKVPFSYSGEQVSFSVSPDRKIYISIGADVYAGNQHGEFKKIYTSSSPKPTLSSSISGVAVSDTKYGGNASNISKPLLATISTAGKKSKKNVEAEQLAWSPGGQYVATVNQANPVIYDAGLHTVATISTSSVVGQFAWLDNTTLLYTINSELWTYNLPSQKAQLLANMPYADSITGLYLNDDRSYVYVTTLNPTAGTYAIRRIGLKGQQVPSYVYNLQNVLPENPGGYLIGLINFSLLTTIRVQAYPNSPAGDYIQQAQAQLQSQGFNTGQLRFQLGKPVYSE